MQDNIENSFMEEKKNVRIEKNTLSGCIVEALQEKKAQSIVKLDLSHLGLSMFDKFIVCTATSNTHAEALLDNIYMKVKSQLSLLPSHVEGAKNAQWIVVDYFDTVVHIFLSDMRSFYDIEGLWADAKRTEYKDEE